MGEAHVRPRLLGDATEAEECVQEVFVRFADRGASSIHDLGAYLFASIRNAAAARVRRGAKRVALHQKAAPVGGIHALDHTDARAVQRALQTLPFEQREVVALKVDAELTFAEIGEILGLSPNAAASRSRYALARLRAALQEVP